MRHLNLIILTTLFATFLFLPEIALAENQPEEHTVKLAQGAHGETQRIAGNIDSWVALAIF